MKEPIIISGAARSGTTLLRTMLDSHKNIYAGAELALLMVVPEAVINTWNKTSDRIENYSNLTIDNILIAYGKVLLSIYEDILKDSEKDRIADKMPGAVQYFSQLSFMLPKAKFVHIIRDGRDVACSLLEQDDFLDVNNGQKVSYAQDSDIGARYWRDLVNKGRELKNLNHPNKNRYYELFYENLINDPKKEMKKLLDFLEEPWDDNVLEHFKFDHEIEPGSKDKVMKSINNSSIGKWKKNLKKRKSFYKIAGKTLEELGYM